MLQPHIHKGGGEGKVEREPADIITLNPSLSTVSKTRCSQLEPWNSIESLGVVPSDTASELMLRLNQCLRFRSPSRDSAALLLLQRKPFKGSRMIRLNFCPTAATKTGNKDYCKIRGMDIGLKNWSNTWTEPPTLRAKRVSSRSSTTGQV